MRKSMLIPGLTAARETNPLGSSAAAAAMLLAMKEAPIAVASWTDNISSRPRRRHQRLFGVEELAAHPSPGTAIIDLTPLSRAGTYDPNSPAVRRDGADDREIGVRSRSDIENIRRRYFDDPVGRGFVGVAELSHGLSDSCRNNRLVSGS